MTAKTMTDIVDTWWYNTCDGKCIGIVKTHNNITNEDSFRIGLCRGINPAEDANFIKDYGDRFIPENVR